MKSQAYLHFRDHHELGRYCHCICSSSVQSKQLFRCFRMRINSALNMHKSFHHLRLRVSIVCTQSLAYDPYLQIEKISVQELTDGYQNRKQQSSLSVGKKLPEKKRRSLGKSRGLAIMKNEVDDMKSTKKPDSVVDIADLQVTEQNRSEVPERGRF